MRVVVTGGCGFLGFHVCTHFRNQGAEVVAFDNLTKHEFSRIPYLSEAAREYNRDRLTKLGVTVVVEDVRDEGAVKDCSRSCDYLCHTAAQPAMTISAEDPILDFSTNVVGTVNVLEAARAHDIPVAVCSSIHTFGPDKINSELTEKPTRYVHEPTAIDEQEPLLQGTVTPLHASKRSGEIYVQSYIDTFNLRAACFRLTGIYGPCQFGGEDHGWVANFAIRTLTGNPISIFGTGKQVRDILFASDAAAAFDYFYRRPVSGIYNLGGGLECSISLIECIELIKTLAGLEVEISYQPDRIGDLRYFVTNHKRFTAATGWRPQVFPRDGICILVDWVKSTSELFVEPGARP